LITGALMGGVGIKKRRASTKKHAGSKLVKGSAEAKEYMARIRAKRSGGALMPTGMGVKFE